MNRAGGKGTGGETQKAFFARVCMSVADALDNDSGGTTLIVIGPGFLKEDLLKAGEHLHYLLPRMIF